jgi:hypothetical protein
LAIEELLVKILGDASKLTSELNKAGSNVSSFSEKIGSIGKAMTIVGGTVTAALGVIIKKIVDAGDAFNDMSLRTGVSVENLSALAYVAKQSGTDIESMETSLKFLTRAMDDTSKGTGTAKDTFAALGITVVDTEGKLRPVVDVMKDIADKVAAIDDPAKQAAIAMELFGARSGTQLVPLLKLGAGGIDELMKKAQELGIVMSTKDAQAADEFKDAMGRLTLVLGAAGKDIANVLIPPLLDFTNKAIEIVKRIREWADAHKPLIEAIILIGAKLAVFAAVGGPILMAVSALAKLKTAFTMLGMAGSGPIGIFIGAIALVAVGAIELSKRIDIATGSMKGFREEVSKFDLAKIDAEIQALSNEANELQLILSETKIADYVRQNIIWSLEEINNKLLILYKSREELTVAEDAAIPVIDKLNTSTGAGIPLNEKLADSLKTISDRLYELTHTQMEYNIKKLGEQKDAYIKLGVSKEVVIKWYDAEIKKLTELNAKVEKTTPTLGLMAKSIVEVSSKLQTMAKATGEVGLGIQITANLVVDKLKEMATTTQQIFNTLKDNLKSTIGTIVSYLENNLSNAIYNLLSGKDEIKLTWASFWEGLKDILIKAVAAMIAKLVILAAFSWLFKLLGISLSWLGINKGGGVGYDIGGKVKGYDFGGGIDTIPAMLTPGEYVIATPMVNFIKRFKAIPQNLISAISMGIPTPTPAFASGGSVGSPNITSTGYGDTNITVNISGNKISDDVDVKKLAITVSDEILRRINLNRRH